MSITTPTTAIRARELTKAQRDAVRLGYAINDYPYQADRTYIIFDATVGSNNLHIDTGATGSYFINKGDGTDELSYNDTGGTKSLTFDNEGRYLITIRGNFNGINCDGSTAGEKDKYISIKSGSNYLATMPNGAFSGCDNLVYAEFDTVTTLGQSVFYQCGGLKEAVLPLVTSISQFTFYENTALEKVYCPSITTIGNSAFRACYALQCIDLRNVTSIGTFAFYDNRTLECLELDDIATISGDAFRLCTRLHILKIEYNASLSLGALSFTNVNLYDLYVKSANGTQATEVETKLTTAGATQLNNYRLIY